MAYCGFYSEFAPLLRQIPRRGTPSTTSVCNYLVSICVLISIWTVKLCREILCAACITRTHWVLRCILCLGKGFFWELQQCCWLNGYMLPVLCRTFCRSRWEMCRNLWVIHSWTLQLTGSLWYYLRYVQLGWWDYQHSIRFSIPFM